MRVLILASIGLGMAIENGGLMKKIRHTLYTKRTE